MHAVLRLTLGRVIPNVQASWVKLGRQGALEMLSAGANDLGGVLINESITRAAGAAHGQMWTPREIEQAIVGRGERRCSATPATNQRRRRLRASCVQTRLNGSLIRPAGRTQTPNTAPLF